MTYLVVWDRKPVTVVQMATFTRDVASVWSEAELAAFVDYIARNPEAGDIVQGTGGVRKIRWAAKGKGKRGGARVIYFFYNPNNPVYLVSIYAKNERETISEADRKLYARMSEDIKGKLK
ncbi:MAG: type II toxin-antitoxin system RelE/ParE family toxin [Rhodospirillaceae bacterium]|nr:type II toxin-antitoxin system RelE/ParE family toxin [Rhodospirillaceae bacterium]